MHMTDIDEVFIFWAAINQTNLLWSCLLMVGRSNHSRQHEPNSLYRDILT